MPKKAETGGTKALPPEMLASVARYLEQAFKDTGLTIREAEEKWGIDKASLSKARNGKGAVGVHLLLKLRELVKTPIDQLLDLPPPGTREAKGPRQPAEVDMTDPWIGRRVGVATARTRQTPEHIIQAVIEQFANPKLFRDRTAAWWGYQFQKAHTQELERDLELGRTPSVEPTAPEVTTSPRSEPAPKRTRRAG